MLPPPIGGETGPQRESFGGARRFGATRATGSRLSVLLISGATLEGCGRDRVAAFAAALVTAALAYSLRYFDAVAGLFHGLMLLVMGAMVGPDRHRADGHQADPLIVVAMVDSSQRGRVERRAQLGD
jgi:hypothetical protein